MGSGWELQSSTRVGLEKSRYSCILGLCVLASDVAVDRQDREAVGTKRSIVEWQSGGFAESILQPGFDIIVDDTNLSSQAQAIYLAV